MTEPWKGTIKYPVANALGAWLTIESMMDRMNGDLLLAEEDRHDAESAAKIRAQIEEAKSQMAIAEQVILEFLSDKPDGAIIWAIGQVDDEDGSGQFYVSPLQEDEIRSYSGYRFSLSDDGKIQCRPHSRTV